MSEQYAAQAEKHWQEYLPDRYASIPESDRSSFFSTLGEQAASQIEELTREIAGPDVPGEGYLDKLGRLNNARMAAQEVVLPQLILIDPDQTDLPENAAELATPASDPWVPMVEDPDHPYWQQVAEEEEDQQDEDPPAR